MSKHFLYLLLAVVSVYSLDVPSIYQCNGLYVSWTKDGKTYHKGFSVKALYLELNGNYLKVSGIQSGKKICKKIAVKRIVGNAVYLNPEVDRFKNQEFCINFKGDTLTGNFNLLDDKSDEKMDATLVVTRVRNDRLAEIRKICD
jgi:hypothetical protein